MDPQAQAHFGARARRKKSAGRRNAAHVKMHEYNTGGRIPRENAALTQQAKVTHRREGNEQNDKRTGARLSSTKIPWKVQTKKVDYRLTTLNHDGLQIFERPSLKMHGFETKLPFKRPHHNWLTRIKGADPRSKWILLEQTAHAGTMPCTDACTLHTRSSACASRIRRQASRLWQAGKQAVACVCV